MNLCLLFGPGFLAELTDDIPADFQPYPGYESPDGKVAKGTQEELLVWVHSAEKDRLWEAQYNFRNAVKGHMAVARETHAWIYRNSLDLTGFIDGTGNPAARGAVRPGHRARGRARRGRQLLHRPALGPRPRVLPTACRCRTRRTPSAAAKRTPTGWRCRCPRRTSPTSSCGRARRPTTRKPKRGEMVRRSTPYAMHDGTVGLYFMGFCKDQAPMRERMEAIYGINGQERDALTNYSTPASGSFYFAPSVETLEAIIR